MNTIHDKNVNEYIRVYLFIFCSSAMAFNRLLKHLKEKPITQVMLVCLGPEAFGKSVMGGVVTFT